MPVDADSSLLIVGWSARAAAASARRGGYAVDVCDAFLDADVRRIVRHERQLKRLDDAPPLVAELPPGCWLYAGGMENYPDAVDAIARTRRLLGNPGQVLRRV